VEAVSPTKHLRVANIIEEGRLGGPQVRIANVAKALKPQVETTVVLPDENSSQFRALLDQYRISYKTFKLSRITKEPKMALKYLLFSWYEIIQLARYFRKEDFDLIHVSGGSWQYKGVIAGKLAGKKVVWHLNDTKMPHLIKTIFSLLSGLADAYIFASNRSMHLYKPLLRRDKFNFIIPAPVNTTVFDPERIEGDIDSNWKGKIVVGTTANINPIKGLELFLRAASKLNMAYEKLFFVIVGATFEGQKSYYKKLVTLCNELSIHNIAFTGQTMDVRPFLNRFDIYVCSSIAESSPVSVWEAMSMAKPVISTDVGDVALYVKDNENGFIIQVDDEHALAEKIGVLIENEQLRHDFGRKARETAIKRLDIRNCANLHKKAYLSICQRDETRSLKE